MIIRNGEWWEDEETKQQFKLIDASGDTQLCQVRDLDTGYTRIYGPRSVIGSRQVMVVDRGEIGIGQENVRVAEEPANGLPTDPDERKKIPLASGCLDMFPDALAAVARASHAGQEQHGLDDIGWDRDASPDHANAMLRHYMDKDWGQMAWRALALAQIMLEKGE